MHQTLLARDEEHTEAGDNMSFTAHHPLQKDNNLISSMCHVDGTTTFK
jgi:hypothetical protein